jgi:deoxyribonuclease-4
MPLFGAHLSIAGGFYKAALAAQAYGMDTVQVFTGSPQTWPVRPAPQKDQWIARSLAEDDIDRFRAAVRQARLKTVVAHDSYLINVASPEPTLYRRSLEALVVELTHAERLGLHYLVMHPGSPVEDSEEAGLRRIAQALDEVHCRCRDFRIEILLENTAGQGACLGHRFEHLARIIELLEAPERVGVCFDTCHAFAAGYALAPEKEYRATLRAFDRTIGLKRLRCFHVNDSLKPLGSRVDRHAHLGRGCLGIEPFRLLVNDRRFRSRPMILETPKEDGDNDDMDVVNLKLLRELMLV